MDRRIHHSGKVEFPLSHYHGISIGFQMETAAKEIPASMKGFSVDLYELQKKYCSDRTPYVIPVSYTHLDVYKRQVPAGDDDGQAVFFADPVTGAADEMIAPLIGVIVLSLIHI